MGCVCKKYTNYGSTSLKYALTGVHGTGKTTLINKIIELDLLPGYEISTNLTRKLREQGYKISEHGDDATQLAIIKIHKDNIRYENIIMDRCALDCLVYTEYLYQHHKIGPQTFNHVHFEAMNCIGSYSKIFQLVPEFDLEDDGVRPADNEFQAEIADIFNHTISMHRLNVVPLTGTVEQRIEQFKQTLGI